MDIYVIRYYRVYCLKFALIASYIFLAVFHSLTFKFHDHGFPFQHSCRNSPPHLMVCRTRRKGSQIKSHHVLQHPHKIALFLHDLFEPADDYKLTQLCHPLFQHQHLPDLLSSHYLQPVSVALPLLLITLDLWQRSATFVEPFVFLLNPWTAVTMARFH